MWRSQLARPGLYVREPTHAKAADAFGNKRAKEDQSVGRFGQGNVSASPKGRPRKDDATPGRDAREGIERGAAERAALPAPTHSEKNYERQ